MSAEAPERQLVDLSNQSGYEALPVEIRAFAERFRIRPSRYSEVPKELMQAALATSQLSFSESIERTFKDTSISMLPLRERFQAARHSVYRESADYGEAQRATEIIIEKLGIGKKPDILKQYKKMMEDIGVRAERDILFMADSYEMHSYRGVKADVEKLIPFFENVFGIGLPLPARTRVGQKIDTEAVTKNADKISRLKALVASAALSATVAVTLISPAAAADGKGTGNGGTKTNQVQSQNVAPNNTSSSPDVSASPTDASSAAPSSPDTTATPDSNPNPASVTPSSTESTSAPDSSIPTSSDSQPSVPSETMPTDAPNNQGNGKNQPDIAQPDVSVVTPDNAVTVPNTNPDAQAPTPTVEVNVLGGAASKSDAQSSIPVAPNTTPLDVPQSNSAAAKLNDTLKPAFKVSVDNIAQLVQTGNLNVMTHGPGDPYSQPNPMKPSETLKETLSGDDLARVSALYDQLRLVETNPNNDLLLGSIEQYYAANSDNMSPVVSQAIKDVSQQSFVEGSDLTPRQKEIMLYISADISNITTAAATEQVTAAQAVYQKALEASRVKAAQAAALKAAESISGSGLKVEIHSSVLEQNLSATQLLHLKANIPFYMHEQQKSGIPWQVFAAIHYKEHGFSRVNPRNGQGLFQLYSSGENFSAGVRTSDGEFMRQLDLVAKFLKRKSQAINDYPGSVGMNMSDDYLKELLCLYNGCPPGIFGAQASARGFSNNAEGSPYVMNFADASRMPGAPNWDQYRADGGNIGPANSQLGAWVVYNQLVNNLNLKRVHGAQVVSGPENHSSKNFYDNSHITIPNADAIVARAEKLATLSMTKSNFEPICPDNKDSSGHYLFCKNLCDHVAAYVWGNDHSYKKNAYIHWKSVLKNPNAITSTDRNPPVGAFLFWGSGEGHVAVYLGGGKILSTDISRTGDISIVDATLVEQKWGLKYHGWAFDPALMHTTAQVN